MLTPGVIMRVACIGALVAVMVIGTARPFMAAAQEFPLLPPPPAFAPAKPPQPFGNLFGRERPRTAKPAPLVRAQSLETRVSERLAQERQRPTVVCPMQLVPADPTFDAAMRRAVPANGPAFTIRTAQPPGCRP
jgi:hypothetical protein